MKSFGGQTQSQVHKLATVFIPCDGEMSAVRFGVDVVVVELLVSGFVVGVEGVVRLVDGNGLEVEVDFGGLDVVEVEVDVKEVEVEVEVDDDDDDDDVGG